MSDAYFVDSNLLVYRHDADEPRKQARAQVVLASLWRHRSGRVSTQVLHEFYVVATRKLARPLSKDAARREVRQLGLWDPVDSSPELRERAWGIEDRFGFSWWDALIVAAAQQAGCRYLLSEDLQDGQVVDGLEIVNPFSRSLTDFGLDADA